MLPAELAETIQPLSPRQLCLEALKADIEKALSEVAAGRLTEFNADQVVEHAKKLLAARKRPG